VKMFKRVAKTSRTIFGTGKGSIVGQLMKALCDWTLSAESDLDKQRLEALDYLRAFEEKKPRPPKFLASTSESRKVLQNRLRCEDKVRSVLPEVTLANDVDVVHALLSEGNALPPAGRLAILECILEIDQIQPAPTDWEPVVEYILNLECPSNYIERLCTICHDITKRAALPIECSDRLFHFVSTFSILEGIRIALLSPHGELHQQACLLLLQKTEKRDQWWFFAPDIQDFHDDRVLDRLKELDLVHLFYGTSLETLIFERLTSEQLLVEARKALDQNNICAAFTLIQLYSVIPKLLHDAQVAKLLLDSHFGTHPAWIEVRDKF